jgi:hypothetical protein
VLAARGKQPKNKHRKASNLEFPASLSTNAIVSSFLLVNLSGEEVDDKCYKWTRKKFDHTTESLEDQL